MIQWFQVLRHQKSFALLTALALLVALGLYLICKDLYSLYRQERSLLERAIRMAALSIDPDTIEKASGTKETSNPVKSDLINRLVNLQNELGVIGEIVIEKKDGTLALASGAAEPFWPQEPGLSRSGSRLWLQVSAPIVESPYSLTAVIDARPLFWNLFGYLSHYLLFAVALICFGIFLWPAKKVAAGDQIEIIDEEDDAKKDAS